MAASIFRYPGGKSRKAKVLLELMPSDMTLVEPFVGGGSIFSAYGGPAIINDKDRTIASFWKVLFGPEPAFQELLGLMEQTPTIELFRQLREDKGSTRVDFAYRGIFFNRTTFSGIHKSHPIGGYGQTSQWTVDCRYDFSSLKKLMVELRDRKAGTRVSCTDFEKFLDKNDGFVFADPPYYKQGDALYPEKMKPEDHERLRNALRKRKFLLTYDDHPKVRELYADFKIETMEHLYTMRRHGPAPSNHKISELVITNGS